MPSTWDISRFSRFYQELRQKKRATNQQKFTNSLILNIRQTYFLESWVTSHWKDWCRSRNSNTLATWREELTHLTRSWCWKRLTAGGEGDDRGWDGWITSLTQWTWVWVNSGSWWWTGRPGVLQFMGSQRIGHDWATELELEMEPG